MKLGDGEGNRIIAAIEVTEPGTRNRRELTSNEFEQRLHLPAPRRRTNLAPIGRGEPAPDLTVNLFGFAARTPMHIRMRVEAPYPRLNNNLLAPHIQHPEDNLPGMLHRPALNLPPKSRR